MNQQESELEQLVAQLKSESALVRYHAVAELRRYGDDQRVIEALLECLEDKDPVELEVMYTSGEITDEANNNDVLQAVTYILGDLGPQLALVEPQAVDRLLTILRKRKAPADSYIAHVLGMLHDPRAVDPLIDVLQEGITQTSLEAMQALIRLKDHQVVEKLIQALQKALQEKNQPGVDAIARALGHLEDNQAIEPLLAAQETYPTPEVMKALATFKDARVVHVLIARLPSAQAAEALWKAGDRQAIEPLIACLQAPNAVDRSSAAEIVGRFGAVQAIEPLIACLQDREMDVRISAARALASLRAMQAIEPLIACLQDQEVDVRVAAIRALGKLGDMRGLEELAHIWIEHPDSYMRHQALASILEAKNPQAYERLLDLIGEKDQQLSKESVQPQEPLRASIWITKPLLECLQDQDPYRRATAARVLAKMAEADRPGFFTGLKELRGIVTQDPDDHVRYTVLCALVATKKRAVYFLLRDLHDGNDQKLSQWAAIALEQWDTRSQRV